MTILDAFQALAYYLAAPAPEGSGALSFTSFYYPYAVKLYDGVYYNAEETNLEKLTFNDNKSSYFYLRLNGDPRYVRPAQQARGACGNEQMMLVPARLVVLCNGVSQVQVEALIRQAIANDSSQVLGKQTTLTLQSVAFDKAAILPVEGYNTEDDRHFLLQPHLQVLAVNFELSIPPNFECDEIDLCDAPRIEICPPQPQPEQACPDACTELIDQVSALANENASEILSLTTTVDTLAQSADVATLLNIDTSADYRLFIAAPTGVVLTTLQYVLGATVVDYALVIDGITEFSTTGLTGSGSIVINQVIASGNEARVLLTNIATPEAQVELQHNYTQSV